MSKIEKVGVRNSVIYWIVLLILLLAPKTKAQADFDVGFKESDVIASYIYKIIPFTRWPEEAKPSEETVICTLDPKDNSLVDFLREIVNEKKNRGLTVRKGVSEDFSKCHILYISRAMEKRVYNTLSLVRNFPVLTISPIERFASKGGRIELVVKENATPMIANYSALHAGGITISSNLLQLITIVVEKNGYRPTHGNYEVVDDNES